MKKLITTILLTVKHFNPNSLGNTTKKTKF